MPIEVTLSAESELRASVHECMLRANPEFELVLLEQLSAEQQQPLNALRQDPSFYGVLRTRSSSGLSIKAVTRDTASLLDALKEPGRVPDEAIGDSGAELEITRLVWDGVLQIRKDGKWICGPDACNLTASDSAEERGALADLSSQALQHAAALWAGGTAELSGILYRYNTIPLTPQWLRRILNQSAIREYLQIQPGGRNRRDLEGAWMQVSPGDHAPWLGWVSRTVAVDPHRTAYKLYLSPLPANLRDAFRVWLAAITTAGAFHFKLGSNVRGLLRPDKMVAYFNDRAALDDAAERISRELSGCLAQGVPFTAELGCGALVSWGIDPPAEEGVPAWLRQQSWRQWVCNRLGAALAVAKHYPSDVLPAWRFALERLRLEGVDVANWASLTASDKKLASEIAVL